MGRTYQILIVEDYPADIYVITEAFKECGYSCELTCAASYQEALQRLTVQSFDLLFSSFGTSVQDTAAFVQYTRTHAPPVPVIILSGSSDPSVAYDAGASAFVRKVSSVSAFFEKIRGIMRFWADVAELPQRPERLSR